MSEKRLQVEVVTRKEVLWEGAATQVIVPAAEGDLGILPMREPVLAALRAGTIRIYTDNQSVQQITVSGGFISVDSDFVTVVSEEGKLTD